ncbi:hypothetical protein AHAS_Ahas19G0318500 [Arachis hypogaea]
MLRSSTTASLRFFRHQSQFGTLSHPKPFLFPITLSYTTNIDAIKGRPLLLYSIRNLQNLDSALHLFHKMVSVNPLPSVKDFNLLFSSIVKMKHYTAAISLIKHFFSLGLKSNICTLNIIVNCLCRLNHTPFAFSVVEMMFKIGLEPNVVTFLPPLLMVFPGFSRNF